MTILSGVKLSGDYGSLIKGVSAQFDTVFNDNKNITPSIHQKYVKTISDIGNKSMYSVKNVSGASMLKMVGENNKIPELNTYLGKETQFKFKWYAGMITVTKLALADLDFQAELDSVAALSANYNVAKDIHCAEILRTGWDTTSDVDFPISKPTGVSRLFSIAHTLANGDTFSNTLANSAPLSADSLKDMKKMLMEQKGEDGKNIRSSGKFVLVVAPANEDLAMRIVNSDLRQGTTNNDTNTLKGIEVVMDPQLSSEFGGNDTEYFLIDKVNSKLTIVDRQDLNIEMEPDFVTKNLMVSVDARWAAGFSDVRGIIGSKGDGSTISV